MIKEAIEKVLELARPETLVAENGLQYATSDLALVKETPAVRSFGVRNLTGIIDYIRSEFDGKRNLVVHVESATSVKVFDALDKTNERRIYVEANAFLPNIRLNTFQDRESANIMLQSCFVPNDDLNEVLSIISSLQEDQGVTKTDDGLSEKVVVKQGVTSLASITLKNRYELKPFRTFTEVPQPTSQLILRVREGGNVALIEADGGVWELEAIQSVRDYFAKSLSQEIAKGTVQIIA